MWLFGAFASAALLGFYDVFKKRALQGNAVIPVLLLNTLFSSLIFLPFILCSALNIQQAGELSMWQVPVAGWEVHRFILLKSVIVLTSWLFGYFGIKHLPLTIAGPINATRPVWVLLGALLLFNEQLNGWQWVGVLLTVVSFLLLSRSGKKEGIDFVRNRWIWCVVLAALSGAASGLYDKFLMTRFSPIMVQSWYNIYQCLIMSVITLFLWYPRRKKDVFHWHMAIPLISLFLSAADFLYFYALSLEGALISVVSMIRRGSVLVSFLFGAWWFHERNLRSKVVDLFLVLLGMLFLYFGSR